MLFLNGQEIAAAHANIQQKEAFFLPRERDGKDFHAGGRKNEGKSGEKANIKKYYLLKEDGRVKKRIWVIAMVCALLVGMMAAASAQTVTPLESELKRSVLAGKTFIGRMEGFASDEEMENGTLYFQICEIETYTVAEVEALQAGDVIVVGGDEFEIKAVKQDEYGYDLTGKYYNIFLYKNDEGAYYAVTDTENRFYKDVFGFSAVPSENFKFLDWSDPEAEQPTELTLHDLLERYSKEEINSTADNTEFSFDENGNLAQVIYRYSPWN